MAAMEQVRQAVQQAVQARRDSLDALRARIIAVVEHIPTGTVLRDGDGEVCAIESVATGASQWANRTWEVTIHGWAVLSPDGRLAAVECEQSHWDGHNLHTRGSEPYILSTPDRDDADDYTNAALAWLSGAEVRRIADRLPGAVAEYIERCERERKANIATLR